MDIQNNFGAFGLSDNQELPPPNDPVSIGKDGQILGRAIQEISLCTPDSIMLAKRILDENGIKISQFDQLCNLEANAGERNQTFAKLENSLQQEVLQILHDMAKNKP